MKAQSPGMRRYLYEYLFYRTVQRTQEITGKTITVSSARALRSRMDDHLAAEGASMADPRLGIQPVQRAIEQSLSEGVEGYTHPFAEAGPQNSAYQAMYGEFANMVGISRTRPDGTVTQPRTGTAGPRLPISPYDPRWAVRSTVKMAGSQMRYVADNDVEQMAGGRVDRLDQLSTSEFHLYAIDDKDRLAEAGQARTLDDISGMSELMGRMSEDEYRSVRKWVIDAARNRDGQLDFGQYMSAEALQRSAAILDELREQGVGYTIKRDRNPGQIRAEVDGTKISVRLTEKREQEHFVGRVYDDGVVTYYSTNYKPTSKDDNGRDQRSMAYTPTAGEVVNLLRIAQGKPVERLDGEGLVGEVGVHQESQWSRTARRRMPVDVQDSYFRDSDKSSSRLYGDLVIDGQVPEPGAKVFIRRSAEARSVQSTWRTPEASEEFLIEAVDSARSNLLESLNVAGLVQEHTQHADAAAAGEYFPEFSGDAEVASIQRAYWDVLRGAQTTLLRPGATEEEYRDKVGAIGELQLDDAGSQAAHDMLVSDMAYVGDAIQKIDDHSKDVLDEMVGSYEVRDVVAPDGTHARQRFNPGQVAKRMTSEYGEWRNQADVVAALRTTGIDGEELVGTGFHTRSVRDRLLAFDQSSARSLDAVDDDFLRSMAQVTQSAIERNGGVVKSLQIDDNGVIAYDAVRMLRTGKEEPFQGHIGQIFSRGEHGEVVTQFAGGENYLFAPGYEARIQSQRPGQDKSVEERTRLRGYEQIMADRIEYQISSDMMNVTRSELGETTSLNGVYRSLYDVRHEPDFIERAQEEGLSPEWVDAILSTEARRVRYPSEVASNSTIHAAWKAENGPVQDLANDNAFDPWILTGARNMAIMTEESDGYFDPVMTNGSVYQGITRYLVEGAEVAEDGSIVPGAKDDRAPLMKQPETAHMDFDPYDRQQMSASNLLNASAVTQPVGTAMMTFGGWTADDPMVVSKEFAEKYGIRAADGQMRPLVVGDKLSDLHGNKGVISLIIDREQYSDAVQELAQAQTEKEQANAQSMVYAHQAFAENPGLDVVMSPFSAVSRFNGGTARELMEGRENLTGVNAGGAMALPHKGAQEGLMGQMRLIVTHKDAESGTRVYDDEALAQGRGRKASSQLAWALGSQGCDKVMAEFYGPNNSAAANFREMLVTMGMDMDGDGTLRIGYDDMAEGAQRRLFEMPQLVRTANGRSVNIRKMRADFGELIGDKGGDLELPFPLQMPTERRLPQATDSSWKLPVMSSHLRSGRDLDDGVSTTHDYTNQYLTIHEMACRYGHAQEELASPDLDAKTRRKHDAMLVEAPRRAQAAYDVITDDLKERRFSGKRNIFKESIMSSRLPNSATAVWTSDPRLDTDQVSMGPAMAESLGFEEDDYAMIWRDPVLRDGGVRYMRVAIDERLTGVAINPVMDKSFDGDFDGDSVAVVRLTTKAAQQQAREKLTVEANLLDLGQRDEDGLHPLNMQDALDVKVTQHVAPQFTERFAELTMRANEIRSDRFETEEISTEQMLERNREVMAELSTYYREAQMGQYGDAALRFDSSKAHVQSVISACVETGAKGSMAKIGAYCRHLGVDQDTFEDLGVTQHTREEDEGVMMATAVKSHGTGIAGTFSQRGVKALRNEELKAVLELTYPVTQSVLQAKHDPEEARQKYEMLMGPARDLWKGRKLEAVPGADGMRTWQPVRDESGAELQATAEEWQAQFMEIYPAKDGLNVSINPEHVNAVTAALTDPQTGLMVDIEDTSSALSQDKGSTMDRLAYGGTFADVMLAATESQNLFDGAQNGHFAPQTVRRNQEAIAAWEQAQSQTQAGVEAPQVETLTTRDVLAEHDARARARGQGKQSQMARTVRAPRATVRPTFDSFPEAATQEQDGEFSL